MRLSEQYTTPEDSLALKEKGYRQDTNAGWIRKGGEETWTFHIGPLVPHNITAPGYEYVAAFSQLELGVLLWGMEAPVSATALFISNLLNEKTAVEVINNRLGPPSIHPRI